MKNIYTVTVDGAQLQYPEGVSYEHIAQELQPAYPNDILLVKRKTVWAGKTIGSGLYLEDDNHPG